MKTSKRFDNAISALVNAFLNDTLAKGDCSACAVGNIVARAICYEIPKSASIRTISNPPNRYWSRVFMTIKGKQFVKPSSYKYEAKENIDATGYNMRDLAFIEAAFETATSIDFLEYPKYSKDAIIEDQYNGLMAVVEVLCEIDGITETRYFKDLFKYERPISIDAPIVSVSFQHPSIGTVQLGSREVLPSMSNYYYDYLTNHRSPLLESMGAPRLHHLTSESNV